MRWSTALVYSAAIVGVVTLALFPGDATTLRYVAGAAACLLALATVTAP